MITIDFNKICAFGIKYYLKPVKVVYRQVPINKLKSYTAFNN